jgi:hypothetical protein
MDYNATTAMQPSQLLLFRTRQLQLPHTMNMMGSTYNADQMRVRSIFGKSE